MNGEATKAIYIGIVLLGTIICAILQFRHDNRQICQCGSNEWDTWTECDTCHKCGRVW